MASHRDRSRRRRRPVLVPVSLLVAAAGLAVAAFLGGFAEAPPEAPPTLGKGATLDQVRIRTTFEDAVVRPGGQDGIGIPDKRYLQIHMKVTNLSDETVSAFSVVNAAIPTVRADGKVIKGRELDDLGPRIVIKNSAQVLNQIHPRVTQPVVMAFELAPNSTPPRQVELDAATFEWREGFFNETFSWQIVTDEIPPPPGGARSDAQYVPHVAAKVNLPVRVEDGR